MAKIKHNNFLDTVDAVFTNAKEEGVLHLQAEGSTFSGRKIGVKGKELYHFGTTGYLGLEQDDRLKQAAMDAIQKYGTQFPLSKSYISHPLYAELEHKVFQMYQHSVIITKNSTLGHMAVIPAAVDDGDAVILDHQVHWSVQNAVQILKTRGVKVDMIRHNNLEMLERKLKELQSKVNHIWYMADGVYSMHGDYAPVQDLLALCKKYPQLHIYFDDVHGMSWKGKHGTGYIMSELGELPENIVLCGTLSKTFGANGSMIICPNEKLHSKIKTYGGPLTFSAQLDPASVGAAIASANIHLSDEIYDFQKELNDKINYFNSLLSETDLPLIADNDSPVFYIGIGTPDTGYHFVKNLMKAGFYTNLGLYPAVPIKNTGLRITISRHNQKEEIKGLVEAMKKYYPIALEETGTNLNQVRKAFKLSIEKQSITFKDIRLTLNYTSTIKNISKAEWNELLGAQSTFDWEGQLFLEQVFNEQDKPENKWSFHYFIIRDNNDIPVIASFFSYALWKDDLLAVPSVSAQVEESRNKDPYYLTSKVFSMGSVFTEGSHGYFNTEHSLIEEAFQLLMNKIDELDQQNPFSMLVLRDFPEKTVLNQLFHKKGFFKVQMPDSCILENLEWNGIDEFLDSLSSKSRRHFRKDIQPYQKFVEARVIKNATYGQLFQYYELFKNVKDRNLGLNTFLFPKKLFRAMSENPLWEFIEIRLKKTGAVIGVMFCYNNQDRTYVPSLIGLDYHFAREFQVYRQLLYETILRAKERGFNKIDFGLSASFEKRKLGATIIPKVAYVQAKDNFEMELLATMQE